MQRLQALFKRKPRSEEQLIASHGLSQPVRPERGKMVFSLNEGELANVIQFLSITDRTGELKVVISLDESCGYIYFRKGEVYHARFGQSEGVEAVSCAITGGECMAYFTDEVMVEERSVTLAVSNLLVQATVLADQMENTVAAEGTVEAAGAEDQPSAPSLIRDKRAGSKAQAKRKIRSVRGKPAGADSRLRKILVGLLIFTAAYTLTYTVHQRIIRWHRDRLLEEQRQARDQLSSEDKEIKRRMTAAAAAFSEDKYDAALTAVNSVLEIAPEHQPALLLRDKIEKTRLLAAIVSAKSTAEVFFERTREIDPEPGLREAKDQLDIFFRAAVTLYQQDELEAAVEAYSKAANAAEMFLKTAAAREAAVAARETAAVAKEAADNAQARVKAQPVWRSAEGLDAAAEQDFTEGHFDQAAASWSAAAAQYQKAERDANVRRQAQDAAMQFGKLQDSVGDSLLERFGGERWRSAQKAAEKAQLAQDEENFRVAVLAWDEAQKQLEEAVSMAIRGKAAEDYRNAINVGRQALADEQWATAVNAFQEALAAPGYKEDETARAGLNTARYNRALQQSASAREQQNWSAALAFAEEAVALQPEAERAKAMLAEARDSLIPRLTVQAEVLNEPVEGALVSLNDSPNTTGTPATFELELDKAYTLAVELPPQNDVYYRPFRSRYLVKHPGRQNLTAVLEPVSPPAIGEEYRIPGLELDLVAVAAGTFNMGTDDGRPDEKPVHEVTISQPFWIGKYEVTNGIYRRFLEASGYAGEGDTTGSYLSHFDDELNSAMAADEYPVAYVSWLNAKAFTEWLTARERRGGRLPNGYVYRLPTEAEWEYVCRVGGGPRKITDLSRHAWTGDNSGQKPHPVGNRSSNEWGIYDMQGNQWEFCYDFYAPYSRKATTDPYGPAEGVFRVMRGGSWRNAAELCRCTYRSSAARTETRANLGFRIVLAPPL